MSEGASPVYHATELYQLNPFAVVELVSPLRHGGGGILYLVSNALVLAWSFSKSVGIHFNILNLNVGTGVCISIRSFYRIFSI
jgi:hypothetical protein